MVKAKTNKETKKKGIRIMVKAKTNKETKKKNNKIKQEKIEIISMDNKTLSKEVSKEPINIPSNFVKITPSKPASSSNTINTKNGRVYKDLGNGVGMYSDTGETFRI